MAKTGPISQLVNWTTDEIVENVLKGTFEKLPFMHLFENTKENIHTLKRQ